jgi:dipeptidyl aminopeptidase/acylaminoacyl peptidase
MRRLLLLAAFFVLAVPASATTTRILAPMDWWPVASPDGSHAAFTRVFPNRMELYSLDLRTHRSRHIASNAFQLAPSWSSDGKQLAYAAGGVLWLVNADGSGKRRYVAPTNAFAPAWRPDGAQLAYLTTHGARNTDLWVGGKLWATNVIGRPAWSPDGTALAFQRDDGIYIARASGVESRVASIANPGAPVWSHDGTRIAFSAASGVFVVPANGSSTPKAVASALRSAGTPSWAPGDGRLAVPFQRGVDVVRADGSGPASGTLVRAAAGPGVAYRPGTFALLASGARAVCPGHVAIASFAFGRPQILTGGCGISGTRGADVIEGTSSWGDVILAGSGNDRVHANDGHTDRVDCGPGRDTVWADRTDRLVHCEIVHR